MRNQVERVARECVWSIVLGPVQEPFVAFELGRRRIVGHDEALGARTERIERHVVDRGHRLDPARPCARLVRGRRVGEPARARVRWVVGRDVAVDARHDPERLAEPRVVPFEPVDGSHRHLGRFERAHHVELELDRVVGEHLVGRRRDACDELVVYRRRRRRTTSRRTRSSRSRTRCRRGWSRSRSRRLRIRAHARTRTHNTRATSAGSRSGADTAPCCQKQLHVSSGQPGAGGASAKSDVSFRKVRMASGARFVVHTSRAS